MCAIIRSHAWLLEFLTVLPIFSGGFVRLALASSAKAEGEISFEWTRQFGTPRLDCMGDIAVGDTGFTRSDAPMAASLATTMLVIKQTPFLSSTTLTGMNSGSNSSEILLPERRLGG